MNRSLRVGVVSPFLDKTHGTERCVSEQIERLARTYACEIVIYSNQVRDLPLPPAGDSAEGRITWRKVPGIPGPQFVRFCWWILANHFARWRDRRSGRFAPDVLFSPGINCLDADVISVHIVFAEFHAQVRERLALFRNSILFWPRLLHRKAYYRLIMTLEGLVYRRERIPLAAVSKKVHEDLDRHYGRTKNVSVIYHGVDLRQFNPEVRASLRCAARVALRLPNASHALLMVGNDWKKKGLAAILEAVARMQDPSIWVLIVGRDDPAPYRGLLRVNSLGDRVLFLPSRPDVERYYAAADVYVGPSLEDAFAMPALEAMACGVPTIVSRQAGISELLTHGEDGLILEHPTDSTQLALLIESLVSSPEFTAKMGSAAANTACKHTWDKNAEQLFAILLVANRNDHCSG